MRRHQATNGVRTQEEVARIMTERGVPMTRAMVSVYERSALKKMARDLGIIEVAKVFELVEEAKPTRD
jgi:hypothetical protein